MLENCILMTIIAIMKVIIVSIVGHQKQPTRKLFKPHEEQPPQFEEKRGLGHNVFVKCCKLARSETWCKIEDKISIIWNGRKKDG